MLVTVTVPDGLAAGDTFALEHDGTTYPTIVVPDGISGGMPLEVELTAAESETVTVLLPVGSHPGQLVQVRTAWGGSLDMVSQPTLAPG